MAVDRALDELAERRRSSIPVELPMPNFWDAVGQLVQHLEAELAETIRSEGMTAKHNYSRGNWEWLERRLRT